MKKSELDLSNLKNSFSTLKECYFDYTQQKDEKMKNLCYKIYLDIEKKLVISTFLEYY